MQRGVDVGEHAFHIEIFGLTGEERRRLARNDLTVDDVDGEMLPRKRLADGKQPSGVDGRLLPGRNDAPLDHVLELSNVAGPVVGHDYVDVARSDCWIASGTWIPFETCIGGSSRNSWPTD